VPFAEDRVDDARDAFVADQMSLVYEPLRDARE
jgi:hypothetical protein